MAHQVHLSKTSRVNAPSDEKATNIVFMLLCFLPLAVSAFLSTDGTSTELHLFSLSIPMRGICLFRLMTGYRCPVCGMTRCFTYMAHGNITAAWQMSHAGIPLFILCIFETVYRLFRVLFGKFPSYRVLKTVETVLIVIVCVAIAFFFIAQFINRTLVY